MIRKTNITTMGSGLVFFMTSLLLVGCTSDTPCQDVSGQACVWAGTGDLGFNGDGLDRRETRLYWPEDIEFAPDADGTPYVLDWNNHLIRKVLPDGKFQTVVGNFFVGDGPSDLSDLAAPGAPGDTVALNHPTDIQFGPDGLIYFAAWHNHKIRTIDPATGLVIVLCGRGASYAGDGAAASTALFNQPKSLVIDDAGAIYILDQRNFRVRKISAGSNPTIATVVGTGVAGFGGEGGSPLAAQLKFETGGNPEPSGALALGPDGKLYIADGLNHRIRQVDFLADTIVTIAGTGTASYSGDGGLAVAAEINNVKDLEFGPDGRLYFADTDNHRVRAIDFNTGIVETVVGTGEQGENGEGLSALETQLNRPFGIAFDIDGNLFVSDTFNSRILKVAK